MSRRGSTFKDRNFLLLIFFEGPWERLGAFFLGVRKDGTLRWEIPQNPTGIKALLSRLARWTEYHDAVWRAKHALRHRNPRGYWRRRVP